MQELHGVDSDCCDPAACSLDRKGGAGKIHLRQGPPTEDVATWIGITGHRNGSEVCSTGWIGKLIH
jgi:hypothetical protein